MQELRRCNLVRSSPSKDIIILNAPFKYSQNTLFFFTNLQSNLWDVLYEVNVVCVARGVVSNILYGMRIIIDHYDGSSQTKTPFHLEIQYHGSI